MAAVFNQMKAYDASKPDVLVKTKAVDSHCDHKSSSHTRELLSYYRFHVQGIESLLDHHQSVEKKLDASEDKRKELEGNCKNLAAKLLSSEQKREDLTTKLEKTGRSLQSAEQNLDTTQKKLNETAATLKSTQTKLKDTEGALDWNKGQLRNCEIELGKTNDTLTFTQNKLDKTTSELETSNTNLTTTSEKLANTEKNLEDYKTSTQTIIDRKAAELIKVNRLQKEAEEEVIQLKKEKREIDASLDEAVNRRDELELQLANLPTKASDKELIVKLAAAEARIADAEARAAAFIPQESTSTRGNIHIAKVWYGPIEIKGKPFEKVLDYASKGKEFTANHAFLDIHDPWHHNTKTFTAVYALDRKGPFKYIFVEENAKVKFN